MNDSRRSANLRFELDTSESLHQLTRTFERTALPVEIDFRQVVHWVRLGDQLTHQIHPYPAKLLPHIANYFLRASSLVGEAKMVLDPFCGTGTVALEASVAGYRPYIADANPLALLIAQVKTNRYEAGALNDAMNRVISRAKAYRSAPDISVINHSIWYRPETKKRLERITRGIEVEAEGDVRDFLRVCLSVAVRRLSFADPSISVPVRLQLKEKFSEHRNSAISGRLSRIIETDPFDEYLKICSLNIERIGRANLENQNRSAAVVVGNDARNLKRGGRRLASGSIPLVITSPPYGSAQKYIRASSLSLNWLGLAAPTGLAYLESKIIGREHLPGPIPSKAIQSLPAGFEELISRVHLINPLRARITSTYLHDMRDFIAEMARIVAPGGYVVLILGNNQVCGEVLRNDQFVIDEMQRIGFILSLVLVDNIKSRGLMTRRNRTASVISLEFILIFQMNCGSQNG